MGPDIARLCIVLENDLQLVHNRLMGRTSLNSSGADAFGNKRTSMDLQNSVGIGTGAEFGLASDTIAGSCAWHAAC